MTEKRQRQVAKRKKRNPRTLHPPPQWLVVDPNRMINIHEVTHLSGAGGISTVYDWIKRGILPPGIKVTPGSRRWRYGGIIEALKKAAEKDAA